jgi:hypothetical protein
MTRALIDAAIVWYEGVPDSQEANLAQWDNLARQRGEPAADAIKEANERNRGVHQRRSQSKKVHMHV